MRKLFTLFVAVLANVGMIKAAIETGSCGNNLTWTLNTKDSTLTIEGTGDMSGYEQWVDFRKYIAYVILPEGLTSVSTYAFNNFHNIRSISIPNSVKSLGYASLAHCSKLTTVTIGTGISSLGGDIFASSPVKSLTIYATTPPSGGAGCAIDAETCLIYVPGESIEAYRNKVWWEEVVHLLPIPCTLASGTCGDNLTWELSCDGVLTISGTGAMQNYESYAPWHDYYIHTLIMEEGVTTIGRIAFIGLPLEDIHLSSTVTRIGEAAFEGCGLLKNIQLPQNLRVIDFGAFQGDSLLESVTLPNSVDSIGNYAFAQCKGLTAPIYNDHIFARLPMSYNGHYTIPDGITIIAGTAFETCEGLTDVTFSSSVEEIGEMAFSYCSALTSVDLSPFVGTLKSGTFYYCNSLTNAHLGKNVQHILYNPFDHCENFTSFTLDESNPYLTLENGLLYSKDKKRLILCPTAKRVGLNDLAKTITSVAPGALFYTTNIDSIAFPEGVTNIGDRVLVGSSVKYIVLPSTLDSIGDYAFSIYHKNFQAIVSYAQAPPKISESEFHFFHNNGPDTLYVPKGAAEAYKNAIGWSLCPLIIEMESTPPPAPCLLASGICGENVTWELSCDSVLTISGTGSIGSSTPWLNYRLSIKEVILSEGITELKWLCFDRCVNLTNVSFPRSMINIGPNAFQGCQNLRTIVISGNEENGTTIENQAFAGCTNLVSVTFGNVISILGAAFEGCTGLSSIEIPQSVTELGFSAFWRCSNLTDINVASGNQTYSSLNGVVFNADTTSLLIYPEGKSGAYTIPYSVITIGAYAFYRCINLTDVTIPLEVTHINSAAFIGCSNLQSITIPKNVNSIGTNAFEGCIGLQSITCEAVTPPDLEWNSKYNSGVFDGVDKSIPLYVPGPSIDLYKAADEWKDFYNILPIPGTELPEYPVIFLDYNSNVLSEQSVEEGSAAVAPNVPAREGYTFVGWNVDIEHIVAPTYAIALYDKIGGTLTYLSEEGDVIATENVDLHLPEAPSIEGKSFKGWLTESADAENGIALRATYTIDNPTTHDDVDITPFINSATVIFPFITGALTYQLVIRDLFGHVVCKIMFSATGHLLGVAFAPSRNRTNQQATQTTGFNFTVTGLDANTTYEYEFVANDETDAVIETLSGSFSTKADGPTDNEQVNSPSAIRKYLEDGHLLIDTNSHIFDAQGKRVK